LVNSYAESNSDSGAKIDHVSDLRIKVELITSEIDFIEPFQGSDFTAFFPRVSPGVINV